MPVDRTVWSKKAFTDQSDMPHWPCPTCSKSLLHLKKETVQLARDASTISWSKHENYEPGNDTGVFTCLLECGNDHCRESVSVCGVTDDVGVFPMYQDLLIPKIFVPALAFFKIPTACPTDVRKEICQGFAVYWCDCPGSLNHFRKAVELILDHLKIKRSTLSMPKGGGRSKRVFLALHARIDLFRPKNKDLAARLEALKWLGNSGSHSDEPANDQFLDACDLLEDFVVSHFEKRGKKIVALTKTVIRKKGR